MVTRVVRGTGSQDRSTLHTADANARDRSSNSQRAGPSRVWGVGDVAGERVCINCGSLFPVPRHADGTISPRKSCSKLCQYEHLSRRNKGHKPNHRTSPRACQVCDAVFKPDHSRARYCSWSCRQRGRWSRILNDPDLRAAERKRRARQKGTTLYEPPRQVAIEGWRWLMKAEPYIRVNKHTTKTLLYACHLCGVVYLPEPLTSYAFCSEVCRDRAHLMNRIRRKKKRREWVRTTDFDVGINVDSVGDRHGWVCAGCGELVDKDEDRITSQRGASVDHIIPLSFEGTHTWNNVRLMHRGCNTDHWWATFSDDYEQGGVGALH